mgnify:CR=1 FL=1
MRRCPNCGKEVNNTAKFCPYCSKPLLETDEKKVKEQSQAGSDKMFFLTLLCILAVAVGIFFYFRKAPVSFEQTVRNSVVGLKNKVGIKAVGIDDITVPHPTSDVSAKQAMKKNNLSDILRSCSGGWYDSEGNLILTIENNTINKNKVIAGYDIDGGFIIGTGTLEIEVKGQPRYMRIGWMQGDAKGNRSTLAIIGPNILMHKKDTTDWKYESVAGVSLNMTKDQVKDILGEPSVLAENGNVWRYTQNKRKKQIGVDVDFRSPFGINDEVNSITLIHTAFNFAHFDKSGLNNNNTLEEYGESSAYSMRGTPRQGSRESYDIGHGEYLKFSEYPHAITLTNYPYEDK